MILDDLRGQDATHRIGGSATLDGLLRAAAARRPDAVAVLDPPNRESFTDDIPRSLTYTGADRMVSAIAGRLRRIGLPTDAIVGIQIANTIESVLTLLGVLRAGLIAMPLPLLWRRAEMVAALSRVSAPALIVSGRIGAADHFALAMEVAAESFPVRHVCGYGRDAPDGLIALDDLFCCETPDPIPALEEERAPAPGPAAHLAVVTWDVAADGLVPVARSHAELIAGGLAVALESGLRPDAVLLSTLTMTSFAGLATALVPWLALGGTLALNHPFDPEAFLVQVERVPFDAVIVPGPLAVELAEAGRFAASDVDVIGVWRAPERLPRALPWRATRARMTDVQVFGEAGLIAAGRGPDGNPAPIPFGAVRVPRGRDGALTVAELATTPHGTLALRGPMVPRLPFPPGAQHGGLPYFKAAPSGFVDTGYGCRRGGTILVLTRPPPGIVSVGGYRFAARALHDFVGDVTHGGGTVAELPDALAGHRLAGMASDHPVAEQALSKIGANPLIVDAFRRRRRPAA